MTKVSASTLARQAAKTKNPALAKRLRAQAAKMRREQRLMGTSAKSLAKAVHAGDRAKAKIAGLTGGTQQHLAEMNEALYGDNAIVGRPLVANAQRDLNQMRAASVDAMVSKPWYESEEQIATLIKTAKKPEDFKAGLAMMLSGARSEARAAAQKDNSEQIHENNKAWRINIVSAFIAKCETLEKVHRGMPKTVVVDGLTLARIVDALRDAGYTSEGKTGRPQWRAVGR